MISVNHLTSKLIPSLAGLWAQGCGYHKWVLEEWKQDYTCYIPCFPDPSALPNEEKHYLMVGNLW